MDKSYPTMFSFSPRFVAAFVGLLLLAVWPAFSQTKKPLPPTGLTPQEMAGVFLPNPISLQGRSLIVDTVAFSPDGKLLATDEHDATIRLREHTGPVASMVISGDGNRLLSGSGWLQGDKTAHSWDLKSGKEFRWETHRWRQRLPHPRLVA